MCCGAFDLRLRFDGSKLFRVVPRNLDFGYDRFFKDLFRGLAHTTRARWSQHIPVKTLSPDLGYYLGGQLLCFKMSDNWDLFPNSQHPTMNRSV